MTLFLSLYIFTSTLGIASEDQELAAMLAQCSDQQGLELLKTKSEQGEIESLYKIYAEKIASGCLGPVNKESMDQATEQLESIRQKGLRSEITKRIKAARHHARHQSVKDNFEKLAPFLELSSSSPDEFISENEKNQLIQMGDTNASRRKDSCTSIDHRPRLNLPARDQKGVGWCYAFTAADLFSYHFGMNVSAMDIASTYIKENMASDDDIRPSIYLTGGRTSHALEYTSEKGFCLENEVPSQDFDFWLNESVLRQVESFFDEFKRLGHTGRFEDFLTRDQSEYIHGLCPKGTIPLGAFFPALETQEIIDVLLKSQRDNFWNNLINTACTRRKPTRKLKIKERRFETSNTQERVRAIDEQLENGNILSMDYNTQILRDTQHIGNEVKHASIIIGRRFNQDLGRCEYLVRNSWGNRTSSYDKEYEVENGHVWISQGAIMNSIRKIDYIEKE